MQMLGLLLRGDRQDVAAHGIRNLPGALPFEHVRIRFAKLVECPAVLLVNLTQWSGDGQNLRFGEFPEQELAEDIRQVFDQHAAGFSVSAGVFIRSTAHHGQRRTGAPGGIAPAAAFLLIQADHVFLVLVRGLHLHCAQRRFDRFQLDYQRSAFL